MPVILHQRLRRHDVRTGFQHGRSRSSCRNMAWRTFCICTRPCIHTRSTEDVGVLEGEERRLSNMLECGKEELLCAGYGVINN